MPKSIAEMTFGSIYPMYLNKLARKERTQAELDTLITWLTGYDAAQIAARVATPTTFTAFFADAPALNPNAHLITGVICGVRVEDIADPLIQQVRYLDKLVDELARGKKMASILRH